MAYLVAVVLFECVSVKGTHKNKIATLYPFSSLGNGALWSQGNSDESVYCCYCLLLALYFLTTLKFLSIAKIIKTCCSKENKTGVFFSLSFLFSFFGGGRAITILLQYIPMYT